MAKPPALLWYPGDWLRDTALRSCSWPARSLWRDMIDLMHDGLPYGHLATNSGPISAETIAKLLGISARSTRRLMAELEAAAVFSRTPDGIIYSRRMVRDSELRSKRSAAGKLGGNPALLVNQPNKQTPASANAIAVVVASKEQRSLFDEAWETYPKRPNNSRAAALRAWNARLKAGESEDAMLAGTRAYASFVDREGTEPRFVKQAATFYGPDKHYLSDYASAAEEDVTTDLPWVGQPPTPGSAPHESH